MIRHDFIYEWDGKSRSGEKPVSWWPGSYRVKIIELGSNSENISYLFPTAVILKNARTQKPMNTSVKNYIHNFAKKISQKYTLDIKKTLWIELDDTIRVAVITPDPRLVTETISSISWRPIRPNELELITPYINDM